MPDGVEGLSDHAIICGYGRVGQMLTQDLLKAQFPFVVVDSNEGRVAQASSAGFLALLGSASDDAPLEAAGIVRAKVMAAVLPDDAVNVFITLTARELNPSIQIIARAESPSSEKKLLRSGANQVVMPAMIGATKIAQMILRPSAEDMLGADVATMQINEDLRQIGLELSDIELLSDSPLAGSRVGDIEIDDHNGFVVVGIKRTNGTILRAPKADVLMDVGDCLIVVGYRETIPKIARRARRVSVSFRGSVN